MLGNLWKKLVGRETAAAEKRETELEQMSPDERRFATKGVDGIAADQVSGEVLGGPESESLFGENDSPSS
jgi:hypothetical protein